MSFFVGDLKLDPTDPKAINILYLTLQKKFIELQNADISKKNKSNVIVYPPPSTRPFRQGTSPRSKRSPFRLFIKWSDFRATELTDEILHQFFYSTWWHWRTIKKLWIPVLENALNDPQSCAAHLLPHFPNQEKGIAIYLSINDRKTFERGWGFMRGIHFGLKDASFWPSIYDADRSMYTLCHELGHLLVDIYKEKPYDLAEIVEKLMSPGHDDNNIWSEMKTSKYYGFSEGFANFVGYFGRLYVPDKLQSENISNLEYTLKHGIETFRGIKSFNEREKNEFFVAMILYILAVSKKSNYNRIMRIIKNGIGGHDLSLSKFLTKYLDNYPNQKALVKKIIIKHGLLPNESLPAFLKK